MKMEAPLEAVVKILNFINGLRPLATVLAKHVPPPRIPQGRYCGVRSTRARA